MSEVTEERIVWNYIPFDGEVSPDPELAALFAAPESIPANTEYECAAADACVMPFSEWCKIHHFEGITE